jgi:hypothetical protein
MEGGIRCNYYYTLYRHINKKKWKVFDGPSFSDHQNADFVIESAIKEHRTFRNPKSTNRTQYSEDLRETIGSMNLKIKDEYDVEIAAETLQEDIITIYHNNCPLKTSKIRCQTHWWTEDLETKIQAEHKLFRKALTSGEWGLYRRTLTKYNSYVCKAKSRSWRRLCEEVNSTPEGARL